MRRTDVILQVRFDRFHIATSARRGRKLGKTTNQVAKSRSGIRRDLKDYALLSRMPWSSTARCAASFGRFMPCGLVPDAESPLSTGQKIRKSMNPWIIS
jgi:hypothetical protein